MSCALSIALTKLDILDVFSEIKVGMSYRVDNQMIPHFPGEREPAVFSKCGFKFSLIFVSPSLCAFGVFKLPQICLVFIFTNKPILFSHLSKTSVLGLILRSN